MSSTQHAKRSRKCAPEPRQPTAVAIPARKRRRVQPLRPHAASSELVVATNEPVDLGGVDNSTVIARVWGSRAHVRAPFLSPVPRDDELDDDDELREVGAKERSVVVNWMIEVCALLNFRSTSLALAVTVLDRRLAAGGVVVCGLQLVGAACIFIASKHEESTPVRVAKLVDACAGAVSRAAVIRVEAAVLNVLAWRVHVSVPLSVVDVLAAALAHPDDRALAVRLSRFAAHLVLLDAKLAAVAPSLVAAAAASVAVTVVARIGNKSCAGPESVLRLVDAIPPDGLRSVSRRILRVWTYAVASHVAGNPVYLVQKHPRDTARIFAEPAASALKKRFGVTVNESVKFSEWAKKQDV